jgi:hypothetical protein
MLGDTAELGLQLDDLKTSGQSSTVALGIRTCGFSKELLMNRITMMANGSSFLPEIQTGALTCGAPTRRDFSTCEPATVLGKRYPRKSPA